MVFEYKTWFSIAVALVCANPLSAQGRWMLIDANSHRRMDVDTTTIGVRDDKTLVAWARVTFSGQTKKGERKPDYGRILVREVFDCKGSKSKTLKTIFYGVHGESIRTDEAHEAERDMAWNEPSPDTEGEALVRGFCASLRVFDGSHARAMAAYDAAHFARDSIRTESCRKPSPSMTALCRLHAREQPTLEGYLKQQMALIKLDSLLGLGIVPFPSRCPPPLESKQYGGEWFCRSR